MNSTGLNTLLDQMTLEEQVSLLAGADFWTTVPVPRLKIPALKVSDGPAGVRGGGSLVGGRHTSAFPVGIALGSSWNVPLLREVGEALADEALAKGAGVLLAPTMNLFRSALNGRNFESYSEDPHLTGMLGTAYVQGLQSRGVAATVKHFVGNESEYERMTISSDISERPLRELYLRPFEMTVKEGGAWAVMTGYNKLNGTYCSEHAELLTGILRGEWKFSGLVMSDWGGTHSAAPSLLAGLDLEMPGPARSRPGLLQAALQDDRVRQAVRQAAGRILRLIERTGTFEQPRDVSETAETEPDGAGVRSLIRRAGAEGTVLLKNNGLLPLPAGVRVAVIGPNAATAQVMGGGSAQMNAHRRVSPLEGLRAALGEEQVTYALGATNDRFLPTLTGPVKIEYFSPEGTGNPLAEEVRTGSEVMWFSFPPQVPAAFLARVTVTLKAEQDGLHRFSLASAGRTRLLLGDTVLIDNATQWEAGDTYFGFGSRELRTEHVLSAGQHTAVIEFIPHPTTDEGLSLSALRFGFAAPESPTLIKEAVRVAAEADCVVLCIGTNSDWETEGVDRPGLDLPGRQNELALAVLAANPDTVVLLQTGGPVLMPWLDQVPALLQGWFPGQEAGHAFADVLLGQADPGGRLPQTFPAQLSDDPTHPETPDRQYPGENGHVEYQEGLFIGYRHVDRAGTVPLFPFGFGLSYTGFTLSSARLSAAELEPGATVRVKVEVQNTGQRAGQQVVQVYVHDVETTLERPVKELKGFLKVTLEPGESETVEVLLGMRSLAYFDDVRNAWVADAGQYEVLIGTSSADLPFCLPLTLTGEWTESVGPG
jgi:beta-glucosidase